MQTFYGIADAHGIESFVPESDPQNLSMMILRANCNRQRHACFFKAEVDEKTKKSILRLLNNGKYGLALTCLKGFGTVSVHRDHEFSWSMIPNPNLDPWG